MKIKQTRRPLIQITLAAALALSACAPHANPPHTTGEAGSPKIQRPKAAPERWFPETPGVYTRTLPNGNVETVIVEAPRPVKGTE